MYRAFAAVNEFLLDLVSKANELVHQIIPHELKSYQELVLDLMLRKSEVPVAKYLLASIQSC